MDKMYSIFFCFERILVPGWGPGGQLGDLPGGDASSFARGVSADGSVVVGNSGAEDPEFPGFTQYEAFRWTQTTLSLSQTFDLHNYLC